MLPNDSDEGESLSEEDSKNLTADENTSISTQKTSLSTENTSLSTENTSVSTQNTSVSTQNTSVSTPNVSGQDFSLNESQDARSPDSTQNRVSRNSLSDLETSRGSSGDCDTSIDAE